MNSLFVGNFKASFAGRGIEFQDFREYTPGDDAKYIDWARSSMESSLIMRRYKEEKSSDIYCYIDIRESLYYENSVKKDLMDDIVSFIYQSTTASGEKFGAFVDVVPGVSYIAPSKNPSGLHAIHSVSGKAHDIDTDLNMTSLMNPKLKRSIIFVITDTMNIDDTSFKSACKKHDIIYIYVSSVFEDTLQRQGISQLRGSMGSITINGSNRSNQAEYSQLRQEQKDNFSKKLRKLGADSLMLNEESSLLGEFLKLMKKRMNFVR